MGFYNMAAILKKTLPLPHFEEFSILSKRGRTIDFILLGLKMVCCMIKAL
jgi:hypothetical protein